MKRAMATLGAAGLAALAIAGPAIADNNNKAFCHANGDGYLSISIAGPGFNGHENHKDDIIPPSEELPDGLNWDAGKAIFQNGCVAPAKPPVVVDPPVTPPVTPPPTEEPTVTPPPTEVPTVVDQPVVQPPTVVVPPAAESPAVQPPEVKSPVVVAPVPAQPAPAKQVAAAPQAAPKAASAPLSVGTNQGYNAQTAVGASDGGQGWLAGVGALAAAGAAVAARRRSRPLDNAG